MRRLNTSELPTILLGAPYVADADHILGQTEGLPGLAAMMLEELLSLPAVGEVTAVAADDLRTFIAAWYSFPLDEAARSLYPGHDCYESCARQWLGEQPGDWPRRAANDE